MAGGYMRPFLGSALLLRVLTFPNPSLGATIRCCKTNSCDRSNGAGISISSGRYSDLLNVRVWWPNSGEHLSRSPLVHRILHPRSLSQGQGLAR
eukprot:scaffold975_cov90-Cylindrotheca_fusiformis.AAC.4